MKRAIDLLIILLCCAWPCEAQDHCAPGEYLNAHDQCIIATPGPEPVRRSFVGKVGHYLKEDNHWIPVTLSAVSVGYWAGDGWSSVKCQHAGRRNPAGNGCIEQNGSLGKHPSDAATWRYVATLAAIHTTINIGWWWLTGKYDEKSLRVPVEFLVNVPFWITETFNIQNNLNAANAVAGKRTHIPVVKLPHFTN